MLIVLESEFTCARARRLPTVRAMGAIYVRVPPGDGARSGAHLAADQSARQDTHHGRGPGRITGRKAPQRGSRTGCRCARNMSAGSTDRSTASAVSVAAQIVSRYSHHFWPLGRNVNSMLAVIKIGKV